MTLLRKIDMADVRCRIEVWDTNEGENSLNSEWIEDTWEEAETAIDKQGQHYANQGFLVKYKIWEDNGRVDVWNSERLLRTNMDPHACYIRLIEALAAGDVDESRDAAEDLATWISKGGDVPL